MSLSEIEMSYQLPANQRSCILQDLLSDNEIVEVLGLCSKTADRNRNYKTPKVFDPLTELAQHILNLQSRLEMDTKFAICGNHYNRIMQSAKVTAFLQSKKNKIQDHPHATDLLHMAAFCNIENHHNLEAELTKANEIIAELQKQKDKLEELW